VTGPTWDQLDAVAEAYAEATKAERAPGTVEADIAGQVARIMDHSAARASETDTGTGVIPGTDIIGGMAL
jgi:hypothetical protein